MPEERMEPTGGGHEKYVPISYKQNNLTGSLLSSGLLTSLHNSLPAPPLPAKTPKTFSDFGDLCRQLDHLVLAAHRRWLSTLTSLLALLVIALGGRRGPLQEILLHGIPLRTTLWPCTHVLRVRPPLRGSRLVSHETWGCAYPCHGYSKS